MRDRAERHGPGGEALEDLFYRFYFFYRNGRLFLKLKQAAQGALLSRAVVDDLGVLLVLRVVVAPRRLLEQVNGFGVIHMLLAPAFPLVHPAHL